MTHGGDAVVIGAGVSGLAAAAALSRTCRSVTIVERDVLPDHAAGRRGVPQSTQLHNVLGRGLLHLDDLFDGYREPVVAAGGVLSGVGHQTHIYDIGHRLPRRDVGLEILSAWRPILEHVGRVSTLGRPNVRCLDGVRVTGLSLGTDAEVRGVEIAAADGPAALDADLVVDASGIGAVGASMLGQDVATEEQVFNRWYASTSFERRGGDGFWMVFPTFPRTRSGLVSPSGPDTWHVSVSGGDVDPPPADGAEVLAYVKTLEDPWMAELLDGCAAIGPTHLFRRPVARRRLYEQVDSPLVGFVALGDAATLLNPLLGLGMSAAAWQAHLLGLLVAHAGTVADADLAGAYATEAAEISQQAWDLCLLEHHPTVSALVRDAGVDHDVARSALVATMFEDEEVHRMDSEMWHLLRPIGDLTTPGVLARVQARMHTTDEATR